MDGLQGMQATPFQIACYFAWMERNSEGKLLLCACLEKCSGRLEIPWMVGRVTTSPHQGGVQEISVCAHGFAWPLHQDDTAQIEKSWRTIFSGLSLHMKTMWIRVRPCGSRKVRVAPADSSHGSGAAVRSPRA